MVSVMHFVEQLECVRSRAAFSIDVDEGVGQRNALTDPELEDLRMEGLGSG